VELHVTSDVEELMVILLASMSMQKQAMLSFMDKQESQESFLLFNRPLDLPDRMVNEDVDRASDRIVQS
jgi:hypothetical protein